MNIAYLLDRGLLHLGLARALSLESTAALTVAVTNHQLNLGSISIELNSRSP
jgi:hypothetical protein